MNLGIYVVGNLGFRACFCPCVVYAQNKHRYEHMKSNLAPHPENGGSCCSGDCMLHAFISVIVGGWLLQVRSPIKPFERWASDNDYPF